MITPENIIVLCWILFLLYWILNWQNAKPSQNKRKFGIIKVVYIVILIVLLLNLFVFHHAPRIHLLSYFKSAPPAEGFAGLILTSIGLIIAIVARHTLADNWSSVPDLKKNHTLITTGIYSYIRHPIYTGMLCMIIGTLLAYPILPVAIYCLVLLIIFLARIPKEEALMTKAFPKEYKAYKVRTKALIPFVY